jgi:hypothetical protein
MACAVFRTCALVACACWALDAAVAEEVFVIEGTYLRNQICERDSKWPDARLVRITDQEIFHAGGVCSIDDKRREAKTISMRVTCKFKSGAVLASSINFTLRDEKTVDMAQQDGSFKAVLNRCPQ